MVLLIVSHDLVYPALVAGHSDTVRATDAEVPPSYGDVSTARLWAPVGHSRRIVDGRDLEGGGGEYIMARLNQ